MATILIVDDEAAMLESMRYFLEQQGYRVVAAATGGDALRACAEHPPDLVILDIMLPDIDGLEVARRLGRSGGVPIIMVSARGDEVDKVVGLEVGADDYLAKPFGHREFVARVRAVLRRRNGGGRGDRLEAGPLVVEPAQRRVAVAGRPVELPRREFDLLCALASRAGRVVSRRELLEIVWGQDFFGEDKTLDVHVARLRQRLKRDGESRCLIETVRGVGYRLAASPPAAADARAAPAPSNDGRAHRAG
jgi:DNA-binding response OmpR family regulator